MSRAIKVEDEVYNQLDQLREKHETFSEVVEGLLAARLKILELISALEGLIKYREWQQEQLKKAIIGERRETNGYSDGEIQERYRKSQGKGR